MRLTDRAEAAQRILNDPAWQEAVESLHRFYYDSWRNADKAEREVIGARADVLDDVIREIESFLNVPSGDRHGR